MSVRLRAGARAVLRREGLVRALDAAARTQVVEKKEAIEIHCHGENGFGMYNHHVEERPHDEKCPYKTSFGDDELCYTSLDKCSAKAAAYPSLKVCCFAERIIEPTTLDECDPNNTHSVAWIDRSKRKRNSTFFKNMGYRGQSCDDWISLMRSFGD